jgi:dihydroorotate dehydrogenase
MGFYHRLVRPLLFRADPEWIHGCAIRAAEVLSESRLACATTAALHTTAAACLTIEVARMHFRSPLGLAAGFDKNARAVSLLSSIGFGHVEVGSISANPSPGNPCPRLFRLPDELGIVVNYGLPNEGADRIANRLTNLKRRVPLGVNVVSTNRGPDTAQDSDSIVIADYVQSVTRLQDHCDYICLNLSCPNTRDGRGFFHDPRHVRTLLTSLDALGIKKPLFLKVAPFGTTGDLEEFLTTVAPATFVSGFSVNLPPGKPAGLETPAEHLERMPGAVSGKPAEALANQTIQNLYRAMDRKRYCIIGSGGVFSAEDAYRKIRLGASLVQVLTALIYEGPGVAKSINDGLARLLKRDGFGNVAEAVGVDAGA